MSHLKAFSGSGRFFGSSLWTVACHCNVAVGLLAVRLLGLLEYQVSTSCFLSGRQHIIIAEVRVQTEEALAKSLQPTAGLQHGCSGHFCCLNSPWGLAHDQFGLRQLGSVRRQSKQENQHCHGLVQWCNFWSVRLFQINCLLKNGCLGVIFGRGDVKQDFK